VGVGDTEFSGVTVEAELGCHARTEAEEGEYRLHVIGFLEVQGHADEGLDSEDTG